MTDAADNPSLQQAVITAILRRGGSLTRAELETALRPHPPFDVNAAVDELGGHGVLLVSAEDVLASPALQHMQRIAVVQP